MLKFKVSIVVFLCFVGFVTNGQKKSLSPDNIGKLLPSKLKGYMSDGAKNTLIEIGTLRYSLAERNFVKRDRSLKILLFDYVEAPIMYNQAIRKWREMNVIENDSVVYRPLVNTDSSAWESYSKRNNHYQVIIGINSRFFLTVNSRKVTREEVNQILQLFPFGKYPK